MFPHKHISSLAPEWAPVLFKTTTESLFSKERHQVTPQTLQENKITRAFISEAGSLHSGELGTREGMSHHVPRQNYQLGEKVAPVEPRVTTQLGIWSSLSEETASVGKSLQKWEETEEKKRKLDLKEKNVSSLWATHSSCVTRGPLLGGNPLNSKKAPCPLIPRRTDGYKHWKAVPWPVFSERAAVGGVSAYSFRLWLMGSSGLGSLFFTLPFSRCRTSDSRIINSFQDSWIQNLLEAQKVFL